METPQLSPVLFLTFLFLTDMGCPVQGAMDSCYDENGNASRCMPKFENAAFNRSVTVSNVCGAPPEDYCMQTGSTRSCHQCESANPNHHHNATYLTDFHIDDEPTWWQSQSMFYGIQYPTSVNLTLHLGKAYEITYVHLKFYTSRPESFAIYKRTQEDGPWLPYQYYSASCGKTYGRNTRSYIRPGGDEREALCTDEFSDISPLTGGNVAFSTLEGRPSAYNFDQSPVLQDWVTATDLMISLDRLNTFGDEFFKDAKVLRSYFYAISDFSVGGRCKCNGHASECVLSDEGKPVCVCEHNTAGADCHLCAPFYQNRPWARATADSANQCVMCNCSDHADTCVFDPEQYRRSGSGGRCVGCRDNTDGAHCEHCRSNFFRRHLDHVCSNCSCNAMGSVSLQCDEQGVCVCRDNVMGQKCDACKPGHHSLSPGGCSLCECDGRGSVGVCSSGDGHCYCKTNVEGHSCNRCKPGSFNLQQEDPDGCQTCFCFGHSLACTSSYQYRPVNITSDFLEGTDGWVGEFSGGLEVPLLWKEGEVYLLPYNELDQGFYKAPEKFMGDQLLSYRQALWLHFTAESEDLLPQTLSVFLEGSGYSVVATLVAQSHHLPSAAHSPQHIFTLRLNERELRPPLSSFEFQHLLSNVTALRISNAGGHNYTSQLSGVTLASAAHVPAGSEGVGAALWVEQCSCPLGLTGQFCERCAPGFTRETPNGGPLSTCVPCNCNQHGDCHPETGVCHCADFTTGPTCEHCLDGYYGNAMIGTSGDCRPCPCPDQTSCAQTPETGDVVCTHCPPGTRGTRCEFCEDGSYGDPLGQRGPIWQCEPCKCHGNVDVNDVGVCDHMTGRCLKCLGHTEGDHCERCQRGYYGNAVDPTRLYPKCKPCRCSPEGTSGSLEYCHPDTGDCLCLSYVTGRDCSQCQPGFFNLLPGLGCERCNCNPIGSTTPACDSVTGQCFCRTGVDGQSCDHCHVGFFGFSSRGCRACNCDPMGSISMQCHDNGTCSCRQGFVGYKCDKCQLNFYHNRETYQCEECPVCYGLVRDQAASMKAKLLDLEKLLSNYDCRNSRGRLYPWHSSQWRENHLPELQGEDYLPNAIEDFLAIQEAREAFISQFTQLETSSQTLELQLRGIAVKMKCRIGVRQGKDLEEMDEEEIKQACQPILEMHAIVKNGLSQLEKATKDLGNMVMPFAIPKGPNEWNARVNESEALANSQTDLASQIQLITLKALQVSNRTYSLLLELLEDNSTELHTHALEEQLAAMQQMKRNLGSQVNESLASHLTVQERNGEMEAMLKNLTVSMAELSEETLETSPVNSSAALASIPQNVTDLTPTQVPSDQDLLNRTTELEILVQSTEEQVNKTQKELMSRISDGQKNMKTIKEFQQLSHLAQGLKVTAVASVVKAKETESEAFALWRNLEGMQKDWPRKQTQVKAAVRKGRVLEEKTLMEVKKLVSQGQSVIRPTLENATQANSTASEAHNIAEAVSKNAERTLTQAKQMKSDSAQVRSAVDTTLLQISQQEQSAAEINVMVQTDEAELSLGSVMKNMEAAKLRLESYSHMLAELQVKLEGNIALEKFNQILNETANRLLVLRRSVESPALAGKIGTLRNAAQEQQSQLANLDESIQEILEERDSLRDIALSLPKKCP